MEELQGTSLCSVGGLLYVLVRSVSCRPGILMAGKLVCVYSAVVVTCTLVKIVIFWQVICMEFY